ncbi:MAG: hypothetical protein HY654_11235, partial [Acidobacteria bacterium]|nr:hypothetical protein [Acidobacteriota bacterium]
MAHRSIGGTCTRRALAVVATVVGLETFVTRGVASNRNVPRFYPDDPLQSDCETQDASNVRPWERSKAYDRLLTVTAFGNPGDRRDRRAMNINTLDEVPDSSWFTNRIGRVPMTESEIARGPNREPEPLAGPWTVAGLKLEGATPGLRLEDRSGQLYFIKFNTPDVPAMGTAAEIVTTKIFHALGYNVPENYLVRIRPDEVRIAPEGASRDGGDKSSIVRGDLDRLFAQLTPERDGSYRAVASKAIPGKPLGPFLYAGTRPDDPNDLFPHEHRRELRGLRVFAAWVNHTDARGPNSLDVLIDAGGRRIVRHYLLDFGSTLGASATGAKDAQHGYEYTLEGRPVLRSIRMLGLNVPHWARIDYPGLPAAGRFEAGAFEAEEWKPTFRNPAFVNARPDDTFWAARRVAAFSMEAIAAIVREAKFQDRRTEDYVMGVLVERRRKILRAWLTPINPLIDFAIDRSGVLRFRNAAVDAGVAGPPSRYEVEWFTFDNANGRTAPMRATTSGGRPRLEIPAAVRSSRAPFIMA